MSCNVSIQRLCLRQQEQPSDEGTGRPAHIESRWAEPHSLRSPGSGHGQRHLPQVNQSEVTDMGLRVQAGIDLH